MNIAFNKSEVDIQSTLQSVRHNLIAKHITLQSIKQRQTTTDFTNQLDIPLGLKDLLINHGFTLDLLLNTESIALAEALGIDKYVAKIISDATKRLNEADVVNTRMTIKR
jgi:hypothetical protein